MTPDNRPEFSFPAGGVAKKAALGAYAIAVGAVMAAFLARYPVPEFLPKLAAVLSALWYAYALHALGRILRRFLAARWGETAAMDVWTDRLTNALLGFGVVGFLVVVLGWALPGDLRLKIRLLFGLIVAASIADAFLARQEKRPAGRAYSWDAPALWAALPAAGCVAAFLSSFTPITHYDSLVYHLALPALYLREGAIGAVPFNLYSFFPAAAEMNFLFILGALPAPEYTINLCGWILALALGAAVSEWCRELDGRESAWISVLLWWTAPLVLLLSQGAYVEIPLAAATFLSLRWYLAGRENGEAKTLFIAAFFMGVAFSIKYTGALTFLILFADLLVRAARHRVRWSVVAGFAAVAGICPAPWLIKNLVLAGNPVFPFLFDTLGGRVGWTAATADGYFRMLTEYGAKSNVLIDLLTGPFRSSFGGTRGGFDVLGDFGWPLVLFGAPLAFAMKRRNAVVGFLSAYALLHFAGWYFSKPVLRFLVSIFPIGVVLASSGLKTLVFDRGRWARSVTLLIAVPWILSNVAIYGLVAGELKMFSVPFGKVEPGDFLRQRLAFYPTFEALNDGLPAGARVLIVGEQRTYHLKVPFLSSNLFAPSPIADFCNSDPDTARMAAELGRLSVAAILMNEGEIKRLGGLARFGFTPTGEVALRRFLSERTTIVQEDRSVFVHRINPN